MISPSHPREDLTCGVEAGQARLRYRGNPSTGSGETLRATSLWGVDLQQTNQPVEHTHWASWTSSEMKLAAVMLEQWYGAFGHVRIYRPDNLLRLRHFCAHLRAGPLFQIGLWGKVCNWKSPFGGSLLWFSFLWGWRTFFCEQFQKAPSLYPTLLPSFFLTIFLTHCGEIHYEAAPFFFILPRWWRERRDRLSRIDNEQGDWHWRKSRKTDGNR